MVKQNLVDVAVFAVVLALATRRRGLVTVRQVVAFVIGAATALTGVLALAATRGSSPAGVFWAMYPFRIMAAGLMGHAPLTDRLHHLQVLTSAWVVSASPAVLLLLCLLVVRKRVAPGSITLPVAIATVAMAGYGLFSVLAGGSYWTHYLVQLAPSTALASGVIASARSGRAAVSVLLAVCAASWFVLLPHRSHAPGQTIGEAIRAVSRPGDSVISLLGSSEIVQASGLSSPYRYLWSLPSRTLDPKMTLLASTLAGPHRPTWIVIRGPRTAAEIKAKAAGRALETMYRRVTAVCGRSIYLRVGIQRAPPQAATCSKPDSELFAVFAATVGAGRYP